MAPKKTGTLVVNGVSVPPLQLDIQKATELIGFEEVTSDNSAKIAKSGLPVFRSKELGIKFVLHKNTVNRPFSVRLAEQYAAQYFNGTFAGQWNSKSKTCNGETLVVDKKGMAVSLAHRCVGLILAELRRQKLATIAEGDEGSAAGQVLAEAGCLKPITAPVLLVEGVDPLGADTNDLGRERKIGDVLFRRDEIAEIDGKPLSESVKTRLSKELGVALRLVYLRMHGLQVSRGPKQHHPELLAFLEEHPCLKDALIHVYQENGGNGVGGSRISNYISLGYAAGLLYLAAHSDTMRTEYDSGEVDMKTKPRKWDVASDYWTNFAQEAWGEGNQPIHHAHKILEKNKSSEEKLSRDALCTVITRSFLVWSGAEDDDGNPITKWKTIRAMNTGLDVLERFGGLDLDRSVLLEIGSVTDEKAVQRMSMDSWKVGDTAWVYQPGFEEPWYGEIAGFGDDGVVVSVYSSEDEQAYQCELGWLKVYKEDGVEGTVEIENGVDEESAA